MKDLGGSCCLFIVFGGLSCYLFSVFQGKDNHIIQNGFSCTNNFASDKLEMTLCNLHQSPSPNRKMSYLVVWRNSLCQFMDGIFLCQFTFYPCVVKINYKGVFILCNLFDFIPRKVIWSVLKTQNLKDF